MPRFTFEQTVSAPIDDVFDFFNNPQNLSHMIPRFIRFDMLTPEPSMEKHAVFDYKMSTFGIPIRWTSLITIYESPHRFCDIQLKGPYSYWHHEHRFETTDGGGTRLIDTIHYELPLGPLGRLADVVFHRHMIQSMFAARHRVADTLFNA